MENNVILLEVNASEAQPAKSTDPSRTRDLEVARALRIRVKALEAEATEAMANYDDAEAYLYHQAKVCADLTLQARSMRMALSKVDSRLVHSGHYYCTEGEINALLAKIGAVGADTRKFCEFMEAASLADIPAHKFKDAMAALDRKKSKAA